MRRFGRQRGAVFVFTLAILAGLTAIVAGVALSQRVVVRSETNTMERQRARLVAESGIQRAIATLCDESSSGVTSTSTGVAGGSNVNSKGATTLQDDWATLGSTGNDNFQMGAGTFRVQILDACGRVNLNTATQAQLTNMPLSTQQIDALLDWRSGGENARPDGAKDSYYNGLPNPYDAALTGFSSVTELLDVRYFGPADLYDPPTTQSASNPLPNFPDGRTPVLSELFTSDSTSGMVNQNGTALRALNTLNAASVERLPPFRGLTFQGPQQQQVNAAFRQTTWAGFIRSANLLRLNNARLTYLLNNYYVGSSGTPAGKINVNTAPAAVLQTVPNLTSAEAQSIMTQQSTGITQLGNLLTIPGMTTVNSASRFLDYFAIQSQTFIVRVIGTVGSTNVPLEAVVKITPATAGQTSATARIIRMEEQPFQDMTGRWGWQTTTTNDVPLEAGS